MFAQLYVLSYFKYYLCSI